MGMRMLLRMGMGWELGIESKVMRTTIAYSQ